MPPPRAVRGMEMLSIRARRRRGSDAAAAGDGKHRARGVGAAALLTRGDGRSDSVPGEGSIRFSYYIVFH